MAVVISDASPLVHLAAIRRFGLLQKLYTEIFIPPAVMNEVTVGGRSRVGCQELTDAVAAGWIRIQAPVPGSVSRVELNRLDRGEAEALALAIELTAEIVLLDEVRGRAVARELGLRAIGTLGVLLEAKRRGLVASFREELERLTLDSQLQLSDEIRALAIRMSGE